MYKDIISYRLAENISEQRLLKIAHHIIENWMRKQPGFIRWEIHKNNDGSYTDIVCWKSRDEAGKAEANMINIPNANDWYACYEKSSITGKKLHLLASFT